MTIKTKKESNLELKLLSLLIQMSPAICPDREFKFHPTRRWRFDFAYPSQKIALEVEGGLWIGGRHIHPLGFEKDCEKYNEATKLGWKIYRLTPKMITLDYLKFILLV